jgi:hypothetical protein
MPFWLTYQHGEVLNSCEDVNEKHFFSPLTKAKCLDGGWFWGWAWQLGLPTAEAQRQAEWRAEATRALAEQEAISKDTPPISYTTRPSKHSVIGPRLPPRWVFWHTLAQFSSVNIVCTLYVHTFSLLFVEKQGSLIWTFTSWFYWQIGDELKETLSISYHLSILIISLSNNFRSSPFQTQHPASPP